MFRQRNYQNFDKLDDNLQPNENSNLVQTHIFNQFAQFAIHHQ